jgi:hypothetical protein
MSTKSEELYDRLPQGNHTRQNNRQRAEAADLLKQDVVSYWLRGVSTKQIAAACRITVQHVNRLLVADRKIMVEGGYATQLAELAAQGVANLPTLATSGKGKPGRPTRPLTPDEIAMRAEYATGKIGIRDLARKFSSYPQRVRYTLSKSPSVL